MKIIEKQKNENKLLKRTDLFLIIGHEGKPTPTQDEVIKAIAEKYKAPENKIEIIYIFSEKGKAQSKVKAKIWKEKIIERKKKEEKSTEQAPEQQEKAEDKKENQEQKTQENKEETVTEVSKDSEEKPKEEVEKEDKKNETQTNEKE